jgi:hypothetical protein
MSFPEKAFCDDAYADVVCRGFDRRPQPCSASSNYQHIVVVCLVFSYQMILQSDQIPMEQRRT